MDGDCCGLEWMAIRTGHDISNGDIISGYFCTSYIISLSPKLPSLVDVDSRAGYTHFLVFA
jgi:hypothetical protein